MTREHREMLQRAVGQIEAIALTSDDKRTRDTLFCAVEIMDHILNTEREPEAGKGGK